MMSRFSEEGPTSWCPTQVRTCPQIPGLPVIQDQDLMWCMQLHLQDPWDVRSLATAIRAAIVEATSKLAAWMWQASMAS